MNKYLEKCFKNEYLVTQYNRVKRELEVERFAWTCEFAVAVMLVSEGYQVDDGMKPWDTDGDYTHYRISKE